ncbi:MAG: UDP-3-O-(3-hydroxymyristoyl)glucosamine N-acyltransferase [Armatimonadetes bacterium]|nr:UDP-3-O-(3-hydroxymyristoyl)glucosamine N-acyltransferase [Armatimonadota bacterium]
MARVTLRELAEAVSGVVEGCGDVVITGAASVSDAGPGDIVLAESRRYLAQAEKCGASAVVSAEGPCGDKPVVRVEDPRRAFVEILRILAPQEKPLKPGVDPVCRVGERLSAGEGVSIGYGSWIGDDVEIGRGSVIHPLVYLGDGVRIGEGTVIHPRVVIYSRCELGSRVTVHAGTVIGSDGFGYIPVGEELQKVPQIGTVVIEDDVEIGSNVTIDRAKTGATRIGRGTKIDNLVQIAHNVKTGESCIIVAQVGLAGSSVLGNGVTVGGQAGTKDHVTVGDGAIVAARGGVFGDVPAGATYSGYPARPHKDQLRAHAALLRLPDTQRKVEELQKEVEQLKDRLAQLGGERVESKSD